MISRDDIEAFEEDMFRLNASVQDLVEEFQLTMGQEVYKDWYDRENKSLVAMRELLIEEELEEVMAAKEPAEILKELADLVYVAVGYAITFGWDFDEAFRRVHESNMSKMVDGKPIFREDGKVLKGPNYFKPDLEDLV